MVLSLGAHVLWMNVSIYRRCDVLLSMAYLVVPLRWMATHLTAVAGAVDRRGVARTMERNKTVGDGEDGRRDKTHNECVVSR